VRARGDLGFGFGIGNLGLGFGREAADAPPTKILDFGDDDTITRGRPEGFSTSRSPASGLGLDLHIDGYFPLVGWTWTWACTLMMLARPRERWTGPDYLIMSYDIFLVSLNFLFLFFLRGLGVSKLIQQNDGVDDVLVCVITSLKAQQSSTKILDHVSSQWL
jgi:hypothetical protein